MRIPLTAAFCLIGTVSLADSTGLDVAIASLEASGAEVIAKEDIDADGDLEGIVSFPSDCAVTGCLFSIIDNTQGTYSEVARQYGEKPVFDSERGLINASGVYWVWDGSILSPWAGFIQHPATVIQDGAYEHRAAILKESPWMDGLTQMDIRSVEMDIIGDSQSETILWVPGMDYAIGNAAPWFIFDDAAKLISKGQSMDAPFVFRRTDTDAAIIISIENDLLTTQFIEG